METFRAVLSNTICCERFPLSGFCFTSCFQNTLLLLRMAQKVIILYRWVYPYKKTNPWNSPLGMFPMGEYFLREGFPGSIPLGTKSIGDANSHGELFTGNAPNGEYLPLGFVYVRSSRQKISYRSISFKYE